jgi:predicted transposase YbfD/YdcC
MLELLAKHSMLKGKTVTTDAMGCQKEITGLIVGLGADYLLRLKQNHSKFHNQVIDTFGKWTADHPEDFTPETHVTDYDKQSGRIERRSCTVVNITWTSLPWLDEASKWAGIKAVAMVERDVEHVNGEKDPFNEKHYYLTSLDLPPRQILALALEHWGVEIVHHQLDVANDEDGCQIWKGDGPENLPIMRKLALNVITPLAKKFGDSATTVYEAFHDNLPFLLESLNKKIDKYKSPAVARAEVGDAIRMPLPSFRRAA